MTYRFRPSSAFISALLAAVMLSPGRMLLPPVDRDESRYAQASRQMVETGDWLDIRFQDEPRYVQPAGVYWLQALSVEAFDQRRRAIWPHRIPSLLAGILAAVLTSRIGARLLGSKTGLLAGALFSACLLFNFEARIATTDAVLLACVLAAQAALAEVWLRQCCSTSRTLAPALCFWVALGLGCMVKGPVALLFAGGTLVGLGATERRVRWMRSLRPVPGIAILIAIVAPWLTAIALLSHGTFFETALGHNLGGKLVRGQESHGLPPGYYAGLVLATFWPASLLALRAVPGIWAARATREIRFLLAWIIPAWIALELVPTKLPHYVLPLYPAIALLAVAPLPQPAHAFWSRYFWPISVALWSAITLALAIGVLALWEMSFQVMTLLSVMLAGLALASLAGGLMAAIRGRLTGSVALLVLGSFLTFTNAYAVILPAASELWISRQVADAVAPARPCPDTTVSAASYAEPSLVFLLGTKTHLTDPYTAARDLAGDPSCRLAVMGKAHLETFQNVLAQAGLHARQLASIRGFDYSNGRRVDLGLYRAEK